jgi:hypothetical protein
MLPVQPRKWWFLLLEEIYINDEPVGIRNKFSNTWVIVNPIRLKRTD